MDGLALDLSAQRPIQTTIVNVEANTHAAAFGLSACAVCTTRVIALIVRRSASFGLLRRLFLLRYCSNLTA